jgi:hypothetical protein
MSIPGHDGVAFLVGPLDHYANQISQSSLELFGGFNQPKSHIGSYLIIA